MNFKDFSHKCIRTPGGNIFRLGQVEESLADYAGVAVQGIDYVLSDESPPPASQGFDVYRIGYTSLSKAVVVPEDEFYAALARAINEQARASIKSKDEAFQLRFKGTPERLAVLRQFIKECKGDCA